jgi:hypothetical protein
VRTTSPVKLFRSVLPEDIDGKPFPALPLSVRLSAVVGEPSEHGPYVIRVKVPAGVPGLGFEPPARTVVWCPPVHLKVFGESWLGFPNEPRDSDLIKLGAEWRLRFHQAYHFRDTSVELRILALAIFVRSDLDVDIGIGAVVLNIPPDVHKPLREFGLRRYTAVDEMMARPNSNHAPPRASADQWPDFLQLERVGEDIAVGTSIFVG